MHEQVTFGHAAGGHLLRPDTADRVPAVVLTTAIAGVNDYVLDVAGRLADEGYATLVLDYYARDNGNPPDLSSPEKVMAAVAALADPQVVADLSEGVDWLRDQDFTNGRVASVGFCIGGSYSLLAAAHVPDLACAVTFYGMLRYPETSANKPEAPLDAAARANCPVLAHYGKEDHLVPVSDAQDLSEQLRGRPAEVHQYPGAGHAFHEDFRREVYRPVAAVTAWARTLVYLDWYLRDTRRVVNSTG